MLSKNRVCLWHNGEALEAATFYADTFPDSLVGAVFRAPTDYPAGIAGNVLTVDFTLSEALANPDPAVSQRAFATMMTMAKIDVAAIEAAVKDES